MTAPTLEAFLATPEPDEDDVEHTAPAYDVEPLEPGAATALESIAVSLQTIAAVFGQQFAGESAERVGVVTELERENRELEALHDRKQALIEETLAICSKSTSKLANSIRAVLEPPVEPTAPDAQPDPGPVLEPVPPAIVNPAVQCETCTRYFADQALLDAHACAGSAAPQTAPAQPAADASVEEWRAFARAAGHTDVDEANRSQIRTKLGLSHFDPAAVSAPQS